MKLSILSGKGGTGKTTLSVNLFSYLNKGTLIDTDTEEPNSHIFIKPNDTTEHSVTKRHPVVDLDKCTFCGKCGDHCNFNAIIPTKKTVLVFDDLCHDCGMCQLVCKDQAISYIDKAIGTIHQANIENKKFLYGKLNVGEVSGVRIIDQLDHLTKKDDLVIVDCPPGVSCSTVAAIKNSDYSIICGEPTPFGISDMKMVVELLQKENIPFGVVVNKSGIGNNDIYDYLNKENIPLLEKIPWSKTRATLYSNGKLIVNHDDDFRNKIEHIVSQVLGDINV